MQKKKRTDDRIKELKAVKDAETEKKIIEMMKPEKKKTTKSSAKITTIKPSNIQFAKNALMSPDPSKKKLKGFESGRTNLTNQTRTSLRPKSSNKTASSNVGQLSFKNQAATMKPKSTAVNLL